MARETCVRSQVESYQRLKKWYLMPPCLTLSIIRYGSRVKWSNPGIVVSYRKGSLRVTLDYGCQLFFYYYPYCCCCCCCFCCCCCCYCILDISTFPAVFVWVLGTIQKNTDLWRYPLGTPLHQLRNHFNLGRWSSSGSDRGIAYFFTPQEIQSREWEKRTNNKRELGLTQVQEGWFCDTVHSFVHL